MALSHGQKAAARALPPCEPTGGDYSRPRHREDLTCWCGAKLTSVSNGSATPAYLDWTEVDEQGRQWIDVTPTFRYRMADGGIVEIDMHDADAWDRLGKVDIGKYSMFKAALGLGCASFTHVHHAARPTVTDAARPDVLPPECHGRTMWAAPDGWRCRVAGYSLPAIRPYSD